MTRPYKTTGSCLSKRQLPVCVFTLSRFVTGKRDGEEAALIRYNKCAKRKRA